MEGRPVPAAPGQDVDRADVGTRAFPRLHAARRWQPDAARGRRAALPKQTAWPLRSVACRYHRAARLGAWIAHAEHADTWRLRHAIFECGWFQLTPTKPERPLVAVSSAAVPGTTIHRTSSRPTAIGTPPTIGTTTSASGWPERLSSELSGSWSRQACT